MPFAIDPRCWLGSRPSMALEVQRERVSGIFSMAMFYRAFVWKTNFESGRSHLLNGAVVSEDSCAARARSNIGCERSLPVLQTVMDESVICTVCAGPSQTNSGYYCSSARILRGLLGGNIRRLLQRQPKAKYNGLTKD